MDVVYLTSELQGLIKGIGRAFFFAAYLPALFFVALHQYAILPALDVTDTLFPDIPQVPVLSGELLTSLLLPFLLAMLLVSINLSVVRLFEGLLPWQQRFLLRRWQRANEQRSEKLYGELRPKKKQYRQLLMQISAAKTASEAETEDLYRRLDETAVEIQSIHEAIEKEHPAQTLPIRAYRVSPTALGNAFAVAEEYPLDRYGMDSVLFWPRLRQVVDAELLNALDNYKMFLDFQLNLALLALIFSGEAVVVGVVERSASWGAAALVAVLLAWLSYRAAVGVARSMGGLISACFDFFRHKLLEPFGLVQPTNLAEEYRTWLRLGAFLRRGELQYWPGEL